MSSGDATATLTLRGTVPDLSSGTYAQGVFLGETDQGQTTSVVVEGPTPTATPPPTRGVGPGFTLLFGLVAVLVLVVAGAIRSRGP